MKNTLSIFALSMAIFCTSCNENEGTPELTIPENYISENFGANTVAETTVINELAEMTSALNEAEANAQGGTAISEILYPSNLKSVSLFSYSTLIEGWLIELVASANSSTGFINPGLNGVPPETEQGGLLGTRLLDENGLELEQMVQKGSFGAALYNHASSVINGDLSDPASIDKLVTIFGTDPDFSLANTSAAATYAKRRSFTGAEEGYFFDIKQNLLTAKAAIQAGETFSSQRDEALAEYLLNWEKSNFATVIFYCNATKVFLQDGSSDEVLGNAMHAYAEGVAFAHGFRGLSNKLILDSEIDQILELLLAPANMTPESHRFLNDATLLQNLDDAIDLIQGVYGFTDAEVTSFFVNEPAL